MVDERKLERLRAAVYVVEMEDYTRWGVPLEVIARSRAEYYADEFGGDVERSLAEDTWPAFAANPNEIRDWASGNMNWEDVAAVARRVRSDDRPEPDYQEAWVNGEHEVLEPDDFPGWEGEG